jgi:tRNA A22 N-methylase
MTKADILREWLYLHGFSIAEETCIRDERFLYAVMRAEYTGECIQPDAVTVRIGKMNLANPDCLAYAKRQYETICKSRDGKQHAGQCTVALEEIAQALKKRLEEAT